MIETSIRPAELPTLLDRAPQGIQYLSLDCFDTLIWRNVNVPTDVFADLGLGGNGAMQRNWAEKVARHAAQHVEGRLDIRLGEVYDRILPKAGPDELAARVQGELDAEARHCFAFAPARDLIVEVKRRGLKVIIVSDIYMSEPQLRRLITQAGGEALIGMIDRIFCSSDHGRGKSNGLFEIVLKELNVAPGAILHVGDNPVADQEAPAGLGITCFHLRQFEPEVEQRLRLEAGVSALMESASRTILPVAQPHRAAVSLRTNDDPVFALGHDVVGPVMHGFASWIRAEAEEMAAATGKRVKLAFLLRDGHLPGECFKALFPDWEDRVAMIEISRFTAQAAAFMDARAVDDYIVPWLAEDGREFFGSEVKDLCCKQMLFDESERAALSRHARSIDFLKAVGQPSNLRKIMARSAKYAERLFTYLRGQGIEDGDAVMLIDIGYNGTVQNVVEPVLRAGMGLDVAGRYLVLREYAQMGYDKKGFIDARNYDAHALSVPYQCISIVEQFCTMAQGSVIDYRADGTPVRAEAGLKGAQNGLRDTAQRGCLAYVRGAERGFVRRPLSDDADGRRRAAMATLSRLLTLPLPSEIAIVEGFHHDANMGTESLTQMVDIEASEQGMRRRGLFYVKNSKRIFLAGELQRLGTTTNLALLAAARFGIDLRKNDFEAATMTLPIEVVDGATMATSEAKAYPTVDGYYRALIPVGMGRYTIGLWLGRLFDYVQLDEVCFQSVEDFHSEKNILASAPLIEGMEEVAPGLYRCDGPHSFILIPTPPSERELLLSIVFRPVINRAKQAEQRMAA